MKPTAPTEYRPAASFHLQEAWLREDDAARPKPFAGPAAAGSPDLLMQELVLKTASHAYHTGGDPLLEDADYDARIRAHRLARQADTVHFPSPTILDSVGAPPDKVSGFARVTHTSPMLSINDVFEGEGDDQHAELRSFMDDMEKKLGDRAWPVYAEAKVDGVACRLRYTGGQLMVAATRGDGTTGDDITSNVLAACLVGEMLTDDFNIEVTGEIYMPLVAFAALNAELEADGKELMKNPRNSAAGAIKLHDPDELRKRPLAFVKHDLGITRTPFNNVFWRAAKNWEDLVAAVEVIRTATFDYATDGAVIKLANAEAREQLGNGTRAPNWACAFKFRPVEAETTLIRIVIQVGRSGVLVPVAEMEPVLLDGSAVSRATLHNEDYVNRLGLYEGARIKVEKAGAIIPRVIGLAHGET